MIEFLKINKFVGFNLWSMPRLDPQFKSKFEVEETERLKKHWEEFGQDILEEKVEYNKPKINK